MSRYKSVLYSLMSGVFVVLFPILSGFIATICNISAPYVYYLQAGFMAIPLIVFLIVIKIKKEVVYMIGFFLGVVVGIIFITCVALTQREK